MAREGEGRRILVTGIADFVGWELVRQLEQDESIEHIAGLDFREPRRSFRRAESISADLRGCGLNRLLEGIRPGTIVHLQNLRSDQDLAGANEMHDINVMGTINLAAAVQSLPFVRKVVFMSSLHAYSPGPRDPAVLTEDTRMRGPAKTRYASDLADMEKALSQLGNFGRQMVVTCLRFADVIGPRVRSSMSQYLQMAVVPTVMGFDPRLQFCHETDAIGVLKRAALIDLPGLYNVAGDGIVYLSRALRLGRRLALPVALPAIPMAFGALRATGLVNLEEFDLLMLRYGRTIDNDRLKTRFGYSPRYSTVEAVRDLYGMATPVAAASPEADEPQYKSAHAA
jgi:UDP-glucose 4-epimerase